ncbi:uncharacterized protein J8A68_001589 [[Candida] subhashii]|uniref:Uncharacterized protein n=1 Tax=[Candida] subhashii TaxID=561895 RepID=A0A8J5QHT7_9ASCO|nr:uncharacterized protein J8A68_001589 [[Candida] subhashii]KAG7664896.1 hypothetical protein J8A68_001589 [[Candida] subhashii]
MRALKNWFNNSSVFDLFDDIRAHRFYGVSNEPRIDEFGKSPVRKRIRANTDGPTMTYVFKTRNNAGSLTTDPDEMRSIDDASALHKEAIEVETNEGSRKKFKLVKDSSEYTKAKSFIQELQYLTSWLVSEYCELNRIPVFTRSQDIDRSKFEEDKVVVLCPNIIQSDYEASSYAQVLFAKDVRRHMSPLTNLIAKNYLAPERIELKPSKESENIPLGLKKGEVNAIEVFDKGEAIMNQLQLLSFKQFELQEVYMNKGMSPLVVHDEYSRLKGFGYNTNGPYSVDILSSLLNHINYGDDIAKFIGFNMKRFWTLKWLEQRSLEQEFGSSTLKTEYECVITFVGDKIKNNEDYIISRAYCSELDLEVDVLTVADSLQSVGSRVLCDSLIYLDPITGSCLLKHDVIKTI